MADKVRQLGESFRRLYGDEPGERERQEERYGVLSRRFHEIFGVQPAAFFSAPGRTELGGNHTDHNHGRVLAAAVNLDAIAAVSANNDNMVRLYSQGYKKPSMIDLTNLEMRSGERGATDGLIRGIAAELQRRGFRAGGFNACISSRVLPGSGLSSSAAIEVLVGTIFNHLYNNGGVSAETLAITGQYAENVYFGKPCGLMDQMACAVGGIVAIDFREPENPVVEKLPVDFGAWRYRVLVADTGGSHSDLTDDYASVPQEMQAVAAALGKKVCRGLGISELLDNMGVLRCVTGDRAILRAYHFIRENDRAGAQAEALKNNDFPLFLKWVRDSGNSSFKWLQNIYSPSSVKEQGVALGLAFAEDFLERVGEGACRVHGGGFAGTIQVFLPEVHVAAFKAEMERIFEPGCVSVLSIRGDGACRVC